MKTIPSIASSPGLSNVVPFGAPPSVVARLDAEWPFVVPVLRRLARGKCRRRRWGNPDELCAEVYLAIRLGRRPWSPDRYALLAFAKGVLRSLFSTESRSRANERAQSFKETKHAGDLALGFIVDPERELVLREEALDLKELIAEVRHDVSDGPRRALFELGLEEGVTEPEEQAAALGVSPARIHQLRHFLARDIHRAARRLRLGTVAEEQVVAEFAPLPLAPRRFVGFTVRVLLGIVTGSPRFANEVDLVFAPCDADGAIAEAPPSSAGRAR